MALLMTLREAGAQDIVQDLIDAIGTEEFGTRTIAYLNRLCGADHFAAFRIEIDRVEAMAAGSVDPAHASGESVRRYIDNEWWRRDPAMSEAKRFLSNATPSIFRIDLSDYRYSEMRPHFYRRMQDRIVACTQYKQLGVGLTVLRSSPHGIFGRTEVERLAALTDLLVPVIVKHYSLIQTNKYSASLSSMKDIERCILTMTDLPRREAEVSARILYGLSSIGAAADLGIGQETVKTYRKRTYRRLEICSERELLTWYLSLWRGWQTRLSGDAARNSSIPFCVEFDDLNERRGFKMSRCSYAWSCEV